MDGQSWAGDTGINGLLIAAETVYRNGMSFVSWGLVEMP